MKEKEALARRYCRMVRRKVPVCGKEKRDFLQTLRQRVEEFLAGTEHADLTAVEEAFGSPEAIALSFWSVMSYPKIARKIRFRNWVIAIVLTLAVLVFASWQIAIHQMIEYNKIAEDGIIVYSGPTYLTEEEAAQIEWDYVAEGEE